MYLLEEFVDMAMKNLHDEWKSPARREIAIKWSIGVPGLDTMDNLMEVCAEANKLTDVDVRQISLVNRLLNRLAKGEVTLDQLEALVNS